MTSTQIDSKNWRRIISFSACFLLALTVSVSCKKTASKFGTDALSPESILSSGGKDTFALSTYTVKEDSFPTDNQLHALLGVMHDPKMGITDASFYTQFTISGTVTQDPGTPVIDSVVLSLHYQSYYGKLTAQTFEVHQLTDDLDLETEYYKNSETFESLTNLMESENQSITPSMDSVVLPDGTKEGAQLRLKLDNAFGFTLMNEAINGTSFDSEDAFKTWFKGLHIKSQNNNPAAGQGGILYFDLEHNETSITVYYKMQGDTTPYSYDIFVDNDCADYNHVEVDNTGYFVDGTFDNPTNGNVQFYTQAFESRGVVKFPSVNDIEKGSLVQAAVLELPIAYGSGSNQSGLMYYPSAVLTVIIETSDYVATTYAIYDNVNKRYLIDLRTYIQSIVSGESENTGIIINPLYPTGTAERIVFNGKATSNKAKPRLVIKYTKF